MEKLQQLGDPSFGRFLLPFEATCHEGASLRDQGQSGGSLVGLRFWLDMDDFSDFFDGDFDDELEDSLVFGG